MLEHGKNLSLLAFKRSRTVVFVRTAILKCSYTESSGELCRVQQRNSPISSVLSGGESEYRFARTDLPRTASLGPNANLTPCKPNERLLSLPQLPPPLSSSQVLLNQPLTKIIASCAVQTHFDAHKQDAQAAQTDDENSQRIQVHPPLVESAGAEQQHELLLREEVCQQSVTLELLASPSTDADQQTLPPPLRRELSRSQSVVSSRRRELIRRAMSRSLYMSVSIVIVFIFCWGKFCAKKI